MISGNGKKGRMILLIFLLIFSGLGIAAFIMSFTKCKKEGFKNKTNEDSEIVNNFIKKSVKKSEGLTNLLSIKPKLNSTQLKKFASTFEQNLKDEFNKSIQKHGLEVVEKSILSLQNLFANKQNIAKGNLGEDGDLNPCKCNGTSYNGQGGSCKDWNQQGAGKEWCYVDDECPQKIKSAVEGLWWVQPCCGFKNCNWSDWSLCNKRTDVVNPMGFQEYIDSLPADHLNTADWIENMYTSCSRCGNGNWPPYAVNIPWTASVGCGGIESGWTVALVALTAAVAAAIASVCATDELNCYDGLVLGGRLLYAAAGVLGAIAT